MTDLTKLSRAFFERDAVTVARELLGRYLVHAVSGVERVGKIVEVEAYLGPHDLASHSSKGVTERTRTMFGPAGHAYVYLIYGKYHCLNVVTGGEGSGAAVLLRALEPVAGLELPTRGPGLLCRAMGIDRGLNGADLTGEELYIATPAAMESTPLVERPRIGVQYAGEWAELPLRFYLEGNRFISRR